jgi:phosphoglycerate dehydrogenase-like enzyme
MLRVAVTDDWQNAAAGCADWSALAGVGEVEFFSRPFANEREAARALADFDVILPMRERMQFPRSLLQQLPRVRLLALTGMGTRHVDIEYCNERGILCCGSGAYSPAATAEFTLALILAAARHVPRADAAMRVGEFQENVPLGLVLEGATLGIIGLGRIGARVASYGRALGMRVLAWSQNLTEEQAKNAGAERATKERLLQQSDIVSLHLILSERSRNIVGATELALMKPGAILVNTSRGPLIDETALLASLHAGRIIAAVDVYNEEPLPPQHPLRSAPNTVLTPHLGFGTSQVFAVFYRESVENIQAFMRGTPLRVLNPEALKR